MQQILDEAFGERFVRLVRSDKMKRADGLIVQPNRLVLYEIKTKAGDSWGQGLMLRAETGEVRRSRKWRAQDCHHGAVTGARITA